MFMRDLFENLVCFIVGVPLFILQFEK